KVVAKKAPAPKKKVVAKRAPAPKRVQVAKAAPIVAPAPLMSSDYVDEEEEEVEEEVVVIRKKLDPIIRKIVKKVTRRIPAPEDAVATEDETTGEEALALEMGRKVYTGRKIDLDMVAADISDILKLLAEISDMNIIATDNVKGTVTMRLKDVPWDQAFDLVLMSKDLDSIQVGNVIRVAPTSQIRKEKEEALAAIKAREKIEPLELRYFQVNYEEAADLMPHVSEVLSDRGTITSHEGTNTLIVKDLPEKLLAAADVIKHLDKAVPQVLIEARIVEASTTFARDIGVQWGIDHSRSSPNNSHSDFFGSTTNFGSGNLHPSQQVFEHTGGGNTNLEMSEGTGYRGVTNYAVNLPASGTTGALGALGFVLGTSGANPLILDLRLSAGESAGLSKTISRPRITTLDNKEAKIQQGESIPFETTSAEGTMTTFIEANLSLTVTPQITPDGSVLLKIKATSNSVGSFRTSAGEPSIDKKEAETEVLVRDGETTVIGGFVVNDKSDSGSGIPYFKNIPVLGWLFKNKSKFDNQTELLIFITPTIVKDSLSVG
ncbi:MAG: type IV pilus secretin PilQ, partial [Thermodesulfobacteriota bacterium]